MTGGIEREGGKILSNGEGRMDDGREQGSAGTGTLGNVVPFPVFSCGNAVPSP